jgi:hypothetical protein
MDRWGLFAWLGVGVSIECVAKECFQVAQSSGIRAEDKERC